MTTYLFDANVLIALTVVEHEHHERASSWAGGIGRFALCPVVEGALLRFLLRLGEPVASAVAVLDGIHAMTGCEFWSDSLSYRRVGLDHVLGHRQLTDAYLVALAAAHDDALVATFDIGLARAAPASTLLLVTER